MKKAVVFLAVLAVVLAFGLYRACRRAGAVSELARTESGAASNRIAELEMKLNHQERLAGALGSQVTNRTEELGRGAVELARLRAALERAATEAGRLQARLDAAAQVRQELEGKITGLEARQRELESALAEAEADRRHWAAELETLSAQRNDLTQQLAQAWHKGEDLQARLRDPEWLGAQLDALKQRQPPARHTPIISSPRVQLSSPAAPPRPPKVLSPLEVLPDGSVRAAPEH
jgi:chromosome segregation ATPase